jgi:glycerol-3-phosphate acyltransferase PlsX
VDCKPEHLLAYAVMGSQYAEHALGIANPRVGLLSIGTEPCKGNALTLATGELLAAAPINFIGNVEGTQIFEGAVDVTVCDGFVGNVVLKVAEGVGHLIFSELKRTFRTSWRAMLGAWIMKSDLRRMARLLDYAEYGGALLLGANGVCVVSHGKSDARAIANAISVARQGAESGVIERMVASLNGLALAAPAASSG